jgi:nicotinamidase-related amidase
MLSPSPQSTIISQADPMLLSAHSSQLLVVDVQERLLPAMTSSEACLSNIVRLAKASRHLAVPITISEQYPQGIGPSAAPIRATCEGAAEIMTKMTFSCGHDEKIAARIAANARRQLVICGIEAHICVLQTALTFASAHFDVFVVADAVTSRQPESKEIALRRLERAGVTLATVEMVFFEWLGRAGTADFKILQQLIK